MLTPDDRKAIWTLLGVALLGAAVKLAGLHVRGAPPGEVLIRAANVGRPTLDSVATRSRELARPLGPGETVNVDVADALEISRLPRIGPALATRIVQFRDSAGPFGSLERLDRVPGVGPVMLDAIGGSVSFNRRAARRLRGVARDGALSLNRATAEELAGLPGIGPVKAASIVADREANGPFRTVDDLQRVSGVGPATLARFRGRVKVP